MGEEKLIIIQQNDTHGCLDLHNELFWTSNGPILRKVGGFSRISKYVKEVKNQNSNVLFFDGGDLFHGSLPLVSSNGEEILPLLEQMNLDGFVPGNWDFAYGKEGLQYLVERLPFPTIGCNVIDKETGNPLVKPYLIKEMKGFKVGVIGLTYPYVDQTMPQSFSTGLSFTKGLEEVRQIIELIKNEADVIVLLSHMGLPLDVKLASLVNGIDILLSGHSHDRVMKPIIVNNTFIIQAGSNSSFLGRLDISLLNKKPTDVNYQLIDLSENFEEDKETKEIILGLMDPFEKAKNTIVGQTEMLLHRMTLNEAPMDRLITDAYMSAYQCDLSFSHGWRYGPPLEPGPLSLYDLHSIIPTNPKMFTLELDGKTLWETLEHNLEQVFSADPFEQKGGYILRSSGLFMTFKPYNPKGHRIQTLKIANDDVDFDKIYKIAGGGEQLFKTLELKKKYRETHAIEVIQSFLNENGAYEYKSGDRIIPV